MTVQQLEQWQINEQHFLEKCGQEYPFILPDRKINGLNKDKVLVIGDTHEPFGNPKLLRYLSENHNDAHKVVVIGDVGDFYSKSRFRKRKYISFEDECKSVFQLLQFLYIYWDKVEIILGNHDNRATKTISDILNANGATDLLFLTETDLIGRMASYFPTIEIKSMPLDGTDEKLIHIYQDGEVIYCHFEISRAQKSATMQRISEYLHKWKSTLGLKDYKVIIQGHNHTGHKESMGDELWIMNPCAADIYAEGFGYIFTPKPMGNPPVVGYTLLYYTNGKVDFNKTNYYVFN